VSVPREGIAMSPEEIRTFLVAMEWVVLGVLDVEGAPLADVVPALVDGDEMFFAVASDSPTSMHLERDPRCCCSADVFPSYYEIKGATVHGRATRVTPTAAIVAALQTRARSHDLPADAVYAIPLLVDAFGFDFSRMAR
jgi:pyridoxamine 5'-phosphate oxidase-like protein